MNWTPEQKHAIETRGTSVIVSASAGSGKTAVLVNRLLQILSDVEHKIKADNIIVVTFTNDAAAEMKQRLIKAFSEKLDTISQSQNQQLQDAEYDWLLKQRSLLNQAKISTIHSFCFDLIRENAEECGVSAQFKIAESAQEDIYRRRALQIVLEKFSKEHTEDAELLFSYLCKKNDETLEKFILSIDKNLNSLAFPDIWLEQAENICKEENTVLLNCIIENFCKEVEAVIVLASSEKIKEIAQNAMTREITKKNSEPHPYVGIIQKDIEKMKTVIQKVKNSSITELTELTIKKIGYSSLPRDQKHDSIDIELQDLFKQIRKFYKDIYYDKFEKFIIPLKFYTEDKQKQNKIIPLLLTLTKAYRDELFEEKKRQNILCFDDAEYFALKLLAKTDQQGRICKTPLAIALSEQYQLIMVDEYQDSNNRQDCIFKLLAHESQNSENLDLNYGDNIFLVGDMKQSIYSFRKANPENFKKAISTQEMQLIKLNKNFRSSQGVINFVNALFQCIMTESYCGEVNYAENEQLNFGAEIYQNLDTIYQRTQILFPQDNTSQFENADKFLLQAECIADKIAHMIADQIPVITSTGIRPCEYKDFCVLMRTKSNQKIMAESFKKRNIPFMCQDNNGFLMLSEIRLIWNLLKITDNPMTDVAMASVLLSPLYGFTTDELAILKLLGNDKKRLYLQIRYVAESEQELSQEYSALYQKCNLFLKQLEQIRTLADKLPLEICIHEIYDMTDLLSLQSLYENAEQRRENLEIFAQQAQSYREHADLTAQSCLSGWLRYLTHIEESENSEDFAPKTAFYAQANFVSVKTIHKAKGLEYPFVFIANLERKFNFNNPSNPTVLLTNEEGIIGLKLIDRKNYSKIKTVAFSYLDNIRILKEKHEEMRLLYVALTRAKQQLFLVMDDKTCKTDKNSILLENCPEIAFMLAKEAKNMQEWILQFLSAIGEAEHVQQAVINHQSNHSDFADYITWNPDQQIQTQEEQKKCIIPTALPDKNLVSHMQKQIAYQYNTSQTILPAKYSVTELSHEETEIQIHEPEFLLKDLEGNMLELKGKAKGTAIHKIMQLIDFKQAEENLFEELEQMQKAGILSAIETEALEPRKLKAFFESNLYQRIAVSDTIQKEKQLFVRIAELNLPENSELANNYANTDGIMIGTLDLLFHESDGWVIVDYKTDKYQDESELLKKYSKQLGLYQKAVELILGEPVKQAYIYYFTKNIAIEVDLENIAY